jgi:hypothetical protein
MAWAIREDETTSRLLESRRLEWTDGRTSLSTSSWKLCWLMINQYLDHDAMCAMIDDGRDFSFSSAQTTVHR